MAASAPLAKRPRIAGVHDRHEEVLSVPKDVTERIRKNLRSPAGAEPGGRFLLLSWNVDGIDERQGRDLLLRTLAVAEHISLVQPAVVFLQEVIPPQLELLSARQTLGEHYDIVCPENPRQPYYCATLLRKGRVRQTAAPRTHHFDTSKMGRHLLSVDIVVEGNEEYPLTLVNTHSESVKSEKVERTRQLTEALVTLARRAREGGGAVRTAILAGDLNARDEELAAARRAAQARESGVVNVLDAWIVCGRPKAHEFTWDTTANTNLGVLFKSRCRFDRCLFISPTVQGGRRSAWCAGDFELVGKSTVPGLGRFPSDHWGVQVRWELGSQGAAATSAGGSSPSSVAVAKGEAPAAFRGAVGTPDSLDAEAERRRKREVAAAKAEAQRNAAGTERSAQDCSTRCSEPCGSEDDEDLRQAIALSLGRAPSGKDVPTPGSARATDGGSGGGPRAFAKLVGGTGSAAGNGAVTIDLDD